MGSAEFDQLVLRRLENGDYCRIRKTRYGTRVVIEFGAADQDEDGQSIYAWSWVIELGASGLADFMDDLASVMRALCHTADATLAQQRAKIADLVEIVDGERRAQLDHQDQTVAPGIIAQEPGRSNGQADPGQEAGGGGELLGPGAT